MKRVNFGVLGCASVARRLVIPAMQRVESVNLISVASRSHKKAQEFADEFNCQAAVDYEALLKNPEIDAIYMPLPTGLHFEWAHKALDAGKHLFLEKSLASSYYEALSIVKKAQKNNLLVKENYMFEYHSQQAAVRKLLSEDVGEIQLFSANFGFPPLDSKNFRYNRELGGGALLDAGGYTLKALDVFFPGSAFRVLASNLKMDGGIDIGGTAMVEINSNLGNFPAIISYGFDHLYQCNIEAWGSKGLLKTNRTFTAGNSFSPVAELITERGVELVTLPQDDHFANILEEFTKMIRGGQFNRCYKSILSQAKLQQEVRDKSSKDWNG